MSDDRQTDEASESPVDIATRVFVGYRELLFSIVYNLLGSIADTEDVLQETWLAWSRAGYRLAAEEIDNPRAYLVRIAVNEALGRQASISRRRESYVGPWLPEPLVTGNPRATETSDSADAADPALRGESLSMALLVVLETLTPLERAVFVLHEVFGYAHTEIADVLGREPAAVRQLAHRAREHVYARRPRYRTDPTTRRQVTERFMAAARGGDINDLMRLLAPDVTLWTDGGGKARSAGLHPVNGHDTVARILVETVARRPPGIDIQYRYVNGDPSALLFSGDSPYAVLVLDLTPDGERVCGIYTVTNPDKLTHVRH